MTTIILDDFNTSAVFDLLKERMSKTYVEYLDEVHELQTRQLLCIDILEDVIVSWKQNGKFIKKIHLDKVKIINGYVHYGVIYYDGTLWKIMNDVVEVLDIWMWNHVDNYGLMAKFYKSLWSERLFKYYSFIYDGCKKEEIYCHIPSLTFVSTNMNHMPVVPYINTFELSRGIYLKVTKELVLDSMMNVYSSFGIAPTKSMISLLDNPTGKLPDIKIPEIYYTSKK